MGLAPIELIFQFNLASWLRREVFLLNKEWRRMRNKEDRHSCLSGVLQCFGTDKTDGTDRNVCPPEDGVSGQAGMSVLPNTLSKVSSVR
jgi:hypothetical protein